MQVVSLALRTWIRYAIPLTWLAAIVFVPAIVLALRVDVPSDAAGAKAVALVGYGLGAIAWVFQLVLVGAVAPAVRGMADRAPLSQWSVHVQGLRAGLAGIAPAAVVAMAVLVGGVVLVVPGLIVLGLLAAAAASRAVGAKTSALADVLAVMRKGATGLALGLGLGMGIIAIDVGVVVAMKLLVALPVAAKNPAAVTLEHARLWVIAAVGALVVISPIIATHVVALYEIKRRS